MSRILLNVIVFSAVTLLTLACTGTPQLYRHWGASVQTAKQRQTVYPQAGRQTDPSTGMDGAATGHAIDSYHDAFKAAPGQ
ncbi:MAG: hypothetical protein P8X96_03290 [Desulfobacteraceae bacterium]